MSATDRQTCQQLARFFKALGDETRVRIVALLSQGELCVCDIEEALDVPQSTVSRHLAVLRMAGIASTRREGQWIHYALAKNLTPELAAPLQATVKLFAHQPPRTKKLCK